MTQKRACSRCGKRRQLSAFTSPRGRVCSVCRRDARKRTGRASHLRSTYDITPEEYRLLLDTQNGTCAICRQPRRYSLQVDHDHAIEAILGVRASIRGLLCKRCNKLLRDCGDDAELLEAAAAYLRDPPARKVLDAISVHARGAVEPR